MSNDSQEIMMSIEEAKEIIALGDALDKLEQNRAFKKLVLERYLKDEAVALTHRRAHPEVAMQPAFAQGIEDGLTGVGQLAMFFHRIRAQADQARYSLKSYEEELHNVRLEEQESEHQSTLS